MKFPWIKIFEKKTPVCDIFSSMDFFMEPVLGSFSSVPPSAGGLGHTVGTGQCVRSLGKDPYQRITTESGI